MSCDRCITTLKEVKQKPNCKACGKVHIYKSNYEVFTIINNYSSMFMTSMGGVNVEGIKYALEIEQVPKNKIKLYVIKILVYLNAFQSKRQKIGNLNKVK